MSAPKFDPYERSDGRWGWRVISGNGVDVICTDGGQGFRDRTDTERSFYRTAYLLGLMEAADSGRETRASIREDSGPVETETV